MKYTTPWWAKISSKSSYAPSTVRIFGLKSVAKASLVVALIGGALGTAAFVSPDPSIPVSGPFNSVENPANLDGVLAGCGGLFTFDIAEGNYGVIPENANRRDIPVPGMLVPVYGYMDAQGVDTSQKRFFTLSDKLPREKVLRSMYDGTTVIWYIEPAMNPQDRLAIENYVKNSNNVIAVAARNPLPFSRPYAVSTWGASQSCRDFSTSVVANMVNEFASVAPGKQGVVPPLAPLDNSGNLFAINLPLE